MKALIVGTGIIGTIYGWALSQAGADVTHYVRKGRAGNYREGVNIDILDERKGYKKYNKTCYRIKCAEETDVRDRYDVVIVPTNSYQIKNALEDIYPQNPDSYYLIMTADWDCLENMEELLPRNRFLLAYPDGGGTMVQGVYWTNIGAELHLEKPSEKNMECYNKIVELFRKADIKPDVQGNMLHWLWLHNAMSTPIWIAYLKHKNTKTFLRDKELLVKSYKGVQECLRLCELRGMDVKSFPEAKPMQYPMWLFLIIFKLLYTYNESMKRYTAHAVSGYKEALENYKVIMASAAALNFDMPVMKQLIKEIEPAE